MGTFTHSYLTASLTKLQYSHISPVGECIALRGVENKEILGVPEG